MVETYGREHNVRMSVRYRLYIDEMSESTSIILANCEETVYTGPISFHRIAA